MTEAVVKDECYKEAEALLAEINDVMTGRPRPACAMALVWATAIVVLDEAMEEHGDSLEAWVRKLANTHRRSVLATCQCALQNQPSHLQ